MKTVTDTILRGPRQERQLQRQKAIAEAVMEAGSVRIEQIAERFDISIMTAHRDLDELSARGLLRKSRGIATAMSTALVESSDVYRSGRQLREKESLALAALDFIEPGQAISLDDSTTCMHLVPHLASRAPLTVITNTLTIMEDLRDERGITLLGLGGQFYNWCSAFMGRMTIDAISSLRTDLFVMSTSALSDGMTFHQTLETIDVKRAMFKASSKRILLVDHTKFTHRALHAMLPVADFDAVIVDSLTSAEHIAQLRETGVEVRMARPAAREKRVP